MNMTDYDLLARYVHQKDNTAFAHLVVRHTPLVRGVATRWLGHPTGSDDISQTVFATLAGQSLPVLAGLHSKGSLSPWLCRVTANAALQLRQAERRRQRRETRSARSVWIPAEQQSDTEALQTLQEELHALPVEIHEPLAGVRQVALLEHLRRLRTARAAIQAVEFAGCSRTGPLSRVRKSCCSNCSGK